MPARAVKTNLLFFTKGGETESIWYYDLSEVKVGKRNPLTLANFEEFSRLLPTKADSERSWTVPRADIEAKNFDLKAVNPHRKREVDTRTPAQILAEIERLGREAAVAIAELKRLIAS
jgi:type I restriction enzyme M protein